MLSLHPCDFTNDPAIIARNDSMAAVNGALAVDLTGQVAGWQEYGNGMGPAGRGRLGAGGRG